MPSGRRQRAVLRFAECSADARRAGRAGSSDVLRTLSNAIKFTVAAGMP